MPEAPNISANCAALDHIRREAFGRASKRISGSKCGTWAARAPKCQRCLTLDEEFRKKRTWLYLKYLCLLHCQAKGIKPKKSQIAKQFCMKPVIKPPPWKCFRENRVAKGLPAQAMAQSWPNAERGVHWWLQLRNLSCFKREVGRFLYLQKSNSVISIPKTSNSPITQLKILTEDQCVSSTPMKIVGGSNTLDLCKVGHPMLEWLAINEVHYPLLRSGKWGGLLSLTSWKEGCS